MQRLQQAAATDHFLKTARSPVSPDWTRAASARTHPEARSDAASCSCPAVHPTVESRWHRPTRDRCRHLIPSELFGTAARRPPPTPPPLAAARPQSRCAPLKARCSTREAVPRSSENRLACCGRVQVAGSAAQPLAYLRFHAAARSPIASCTRPLRCPCAGLLSPSLVRWSLLAAPPLWPLVRTAQRPASPAPPPSPSFLRQGAASPRCPRPAADFAQRPRCHLAAAQPLRCAGLVPRHAAAAW